MGFRFKSNGESKFNIQVTTLADGYIVVHCGDITNLSVDVAPAISLTVQKILKQNPAMRVRATMPIVKDGHTIAVHIWFDE